MRDMVGRIIDDCAGARERRKQTPWGGVGTKYIQRTLDWLMDPSTGFPENLDIRKLSILTIFWSQTEPYSKEYNFSYGHGVCTLSTHCV